MTIDYVPQILELQRGLMATAEKTKSMWQDEVADRYFQKYIECYDKYINDYLQGNEITGMGLEDLLNFFEEKAQKMTELTGCPNPIADHVEAEGEVHDIYLNRNMDGFEPSVPNPDYLDQEKVQGIEDERDENDRRNEMESPFQSFGRY